MNRSLHIAVAILTGLSLACGGGKEADDLAQVDPVALPDTPVNPTSMPNWLSGVSVGSEPRMFVVLAGNWTVGEEDGERILRLDGSQWVPGTPPTQLSDKAAALFGSTSRGPSEQARHFETRVLEGLQFPYGVDRSIGIFGNGGLQVDFRLVGGESDQYAAILFGLGADGNHYAFRYNTKDNNAALWKVVDGARERVLDGSVHIALPLGEWHTLKLRLDGPRLTGWVNDIEALTYTFPEAVTGRVGLWSKADSITDYRNLRAIRP